MKKILPYAFSLSFDRVNWNAMEHGIRVMRDTALRDYGFDIAPDHYVWTFDSFPMIQITLVHVGQQTISFVA